MKKINIKFSIIFLFFLIGFSYFMKLNIEEKTDYESFSVLDSLSYLKVRALAANKKNSIFKNINQLKAAIESDDVFVEDLRERGIIPDRFTLYSPLLNFRDSTNHISKSRNEIWVDYTTQNIKNNIYYVDVSSYVCRYQNRYFKKEESPCKNNIYSFNLSDKD